MPVIMSLTMRGVIPRAVRGEEQNRRGLGCEHLKMIACHVCIDRELREQGRRRGRKLYSTIFAGGRERGSVLSRPGGLYSS